MRLRLNMQSKHSFRYWGRSSRRNSTPAAQSASEGRKPRWMRVQGETSAVSPCAILTREDERRCYTAPRWVDD